MWKIIQSGNVMDMKEDKANPQNLKETLICYCHFKSCFQSLYICSFHQMNYSWTYKGVPIVLLCCHSITCTPGGDYKWLWLVQVCSTVVIIRENYVHLVLEQVYLDRK